MELTDRLISMTADLQLLSDLCREMAVKHSGFGFSSQAKAFAELCDAHLVFCKTAIENAKTGDFTDSIRLLASAHPDLWEASALPSAGPTSS
jgi:hypothetical protein